MELGSFKTDTQKEVDGIWFEVGNGGRVKLARMNNPQYLERMQQLTKPHSLEIRRGTIDTDVLDKIIAQCLAEKVILDWEGLVLYGEPVPYSVERVTEILLDSSLKDFREFLVNEARSSDNFRAAAQEDTAKNSESISDGN